MCNAPTCTRLSSRSAVSGNPAKFGLGFVSLLFDLVFLTQHYALYRPRSATCDPLEDAHPAAGCARAINDAAPHGGAGTSCTSTRSPTTLTQSPSPFTLTLIHHPRPHLKQAPVARRAAAAAAAATVPGQSAPRRLATNGELRCWRAPTLAPTRTARSLSSAAKNRAKEHASAGAPPDMPYTMGDVACNLCDCAVRNLVSVQHTLCWRLHQLRCPKEKPHQTHALHQGTLLCCSSPALRCSCACCLLMPSDARSAT